MRQFDENTNAYIDAVCKEIRWKKAHEPVKRELSAHIEDQAAAFIASGMSESEAEARAVAEMGDPVTTGMKLDASYRPKSLLAVLIPLGVVLLLCVLSKFTVYGAYMSGREWVEFIAALIIGGGAFAALLQVNLDHFIRLSPYTIGAALLAMFLWRYVVSPIGNQGTGALNYAVCVLPALVAGLACSLRGKGVWAVLICGICVAVAELVLLTLPSAANGFALALACLFMLMLAIIGTPLPLPFISSGNTALVINLAMMGLLLSLLRTDGLYTDTEAKPAPKLRIRLEWEG